MDTSEFIEQHKTDDVRSLALHAPRHPDVDMPYALEQIAGWQKARTKLPSWTMKPSIIYPSALSLEQCSSETTALYKRQVIASKIDSSQLGCLSMADITGGLGVDFSFLAPLFRHATYVERQPRLCEIARHNLEALDISHAEVVCNEAEDYLCSMKPCNFIYIDPARRDSKGARTFAIEDCSPDVARLNSMLLTKASAVMIKLSPMLDWHSALSTLHGVSEVHIVSVANECKELLLLLTRHTKEKPATTLFCINDSQRLSYTLYDAETLKDRIHPPLPDIAPNDASTAKMFLLEPNASVMKAGCFALLSQKYGIEKIAANSNLFVSADETVDFSGRRFIIDAISSMNKHDLRTALQGIGRANVAVRNFPLTAQQLRKRLKLDDGGSSYIFGTTDSAGRHIIIICRKAE